MIDIRSIFTDLLHNTPAWNKSAPPPPPELPKPGTSFIKPANLQAAVADLQSLVNVYEKDLRFQLSDDLNRVIVKVINSNTEEIIKEIPSERVQRMLVRIREALGVIVDYRI